MTRLRDGMRLFHGSYAPVESYLGGLYGDIESDEAVNDTTKRLLPDKLEDQFCFLTEKAISCLVFQEAIKYVI